MIIIIESAGQLANRMILFSHFIGFCKENNITLLNPSFIDYAHYFKGSISNFIPKFSSNKNDEQSNKNKPSRIKIYGIKIFSKLISKIFCNSNYNGKIITSINLSTEKYINKEFDLNEIENIELLNKAKLTFVKGWLFRDYKNVEKHYETIKNYFEPLNIYLHNINNFIAHLRNQYDKLIGVHIRRDDYRNYENGKFYYEDEIYIKYIKQLKNIFNDCNIIFILFSNEKIDTEFYKKENLNITIGLGDFIEDLYSLSKCDYIIGPPSTYSLWASYYGKVSHRFIQSKNEKLKIEDFEVITTL